MDILFSEGSLQKLTQNFWLMQCTEIKGVAILLTW